MIIKMKTGATEKDIQGVVDFLKENNLKTDMIKGAERTVIGAIGDPSYIDTDLVLELDGVEDVTRITKPYRLASLERKKVMNGGEVAYTIVNISDVKVGGNEPVFIAGPCAVESEDQVVTIARYSRDSGAQMLRGGAYKPRKSPYTFQGLGEEGLKYLQIAKQETGLPIVTELTSEKNIDLFAKYDVDCIQIGALNNGNYDLLKEVAKVGKPILLKKGMATTLEVYLQAAEYILERGNPNVILCERGMQTFENYTRYTLDLGIVAAMKYLETHLPVIVDPSHGTGNRDLVVPTGLAALALGADGLIVETHNDPKKALCDGPQAISQQQLENLIQKGREVYKTTRPVLINS